MDRCRCPEYAEAVEKLRFYTVGTYRPDVIDNFDRRGYCVVWCKNKVDLYDYRVEKPKAAQIFIQEETPEIRKLERMWCPYMNPVKI